MSAIDYQDPLTKETVDDIMSILPKQWQEMDCHPTLMARLLTDILLRYRAKIEKRVLPNATAVFSSEFAIEHANT